MKFCMKAASLLSLSFSWIVVMKLKNMKKFLQTPNSLDSLWLQNRRIWRSFWQTPNSLDSLWWQNRRIWRNFYKHPIHWIHCGDEIEYDEVFSKHRNSLDSLWRWNRIWWSFFKTPQFIGFICGDEIEYDEVFFKDTNCDTASQYLAYDSGRWAVTAP